MSDDKKYLSYSGYQKYSQCPHKYDLHYNQKIRPESTSSVLLYGSAVDKAMNLFLLDPDMVNALAEGQIELCRLFTDNIALQDVDYDGDLITEAQLPYLLSALKDCGWEGDNHNALAYGLMEKHEQSQAMSVNQQRALATLVYYSFSGKVLLSLEAFEKYVAPELELVTSIQGKVKRGLYDFKAHLHNRDGEYICDIKTAARPYASDAAETSVQMAGYGAHKAAYIVFGKTPKKYRGKQCTQCGAAPRNSKDAVCMNRVMSNGLHKNCCGDFKPTVICEIIPQKVFGSISERMRTMTEDAYQKTEQLIETKVFPKNLTNCGKHFGRPCEYINLCYGGSMKGLVKK